MTPRGRQKTLINILLALALGANVAFWGGSRGLFAKWSGVPPVPSHTGAIMMTLGDAEFSYRMGALSLQMMGDGGGQQTPLKDYNFEKLSKWFWLLNGLDPASNAVPMIASDYFGGSGDKEDVRIVIDFLSTIGQNPVGNKWRWLFESIYLARHKLKDLDLALDLSYKLAHMKPIGDTLPIWARQMPAFVLRDDGDKEAAAAIVKQLLSSKQYFSEGDIKFMKMVLIRQLHVPKAEVDKIMQQRALDKKDTEPAVKPAAPHMPVPMPG